MGWTMRKLNYTEKKLFVVVTMLGVLFVGALLGGTYHQYLHKLAVTWTPAEAEKAFTQ